MKTTIALFLSLGLLFAGASAQAEKSDVDFNRCVSNLLKGNYCFDSQAEVICGMLSNHAVNCAMDLVDMNQYPDIFSALEYCQFPFPGRTPPGQQ